MGNIIACLDVKDGKVVKGTKFKDLEEIDDPVSLAKRYEKEGFDELYYYDIAATEENRGAVYDLIEKIREVTTMPLTVGGGIKSEEDIKKLFDLGVDKVSINSAALDNPELIRRGAYLFGGKRIVAAVDYKKTDGDYFLYKKGGREKTELRALEQLKKYEEYGAGELCLNAIDNDGTREGYDLEFLKKVKENVNIPVIASGGAGSAEDFKKAFDAGIDKALAASIFHYDKVSIRKIRELLIEDLTFDENGLIPCVVQDAKSGDVLILAYMNKESILRSMETKNSWFYSRSRQKLWMKGEESGNTQRIIQMKADCDKDALLIRVVKKGPACHTGKESCFYNDIFGMKTADRNILFEEYDRIKKRKEQPEDGYTDYLFREGLDKILKKVGEETTETVIAAKNRSRAEVVYEASDLLYHLNVLLVEQNVTLDEIMEEIEERF